MSKTLKRVLSMVLAVTMIFSLSVSAFAEGAGQAASPEAAKGAAVRILDIEKIDPSTVNISRLGQAAGSEASELEQPQYGLNDAVRVSIFLEAPSALDAGYSIQGIGSNADAIAYQNTLLAQQRSLAQQISETVLGGEPLDVKWNFTLAGNMMSAYVPFGKIDAIKGLDAVTDVVLENQYQPETVDSDAASPNMISARDMTGTSMPFASDYTGAGSRIAVVDTGLDWEHQSFDPDAFMHAIEEDIANGKTVNLMTEDDIPSTGLHGSGIYLNAKIPYAYNYVDSNTTVNHLSDTQEEHGSHVSGISAANRYLKQGDEFVDAAETVGVVGQAPDAQLFVMKVFGARGGAYDSDYMAAIEDALVLGADCVNLSLGSSAPGTTSVTNTTYRTLFNNMIGKGLVMSISAGNNTSWDSNKQLYSDDINYDTAGSPGSFANSFTVASIDDSGLKAPYLLFNNEIELRYMDGGGAAANAPMTTIAGEYEFVYVDGPGVDDNNNVGKTGDAFLALGRDVVEGKVALCNRGTSSFFAKANAAVGQGAVGVIIVNNQAGTISMALDGYSYTNPVASIKQAEGVMIKEASEAHTAEGITYYTGTIKVGGTDDKTPMKFFEMSSFSSWGVAGSLTLKPEITTPGGSVLSLNGFHNNATGGGQSGGHDAYELMSGTSMAAPQVNGIMAVLGEYYRANGIAEKTGLSFRTFAHSVIMSTAVPVKEEASNNYYSLIKQGAGLADVNAAIQTRTFILMDEKATRSAADGKVKAELGDDPARTGKYTYSFTITNFGETDVTYKVGTDLFTQALENNDQNLSHLVEKLKADEVITWIVEGAENPYDVNEDGVSNELDPQAVIDMAAGVYPEDADFNKAVADADRDDVITSYDAYLLLEKMDQAGLIGADYVVPAGGKALVTISLSLTENQKAALDNSPRKGAYVEGYTFLKGNDGVEHSIPVLAFYGSWTDPSMYDAVTYTEKLYGSSQSSYFLAANANTNYLSILYNGAQNATIFTGNPYVVEEVFPEDRLALNSNSTISAVAFNLIRPAGSSFTAVTKEDGTILNLSNVTARTSAAYYNTQLTTPAWQSTGTTSVALNVNPGTLGLADGEKFTAGFYALPEYYTFEANDNHEAITLTQDQVRTLLASGTIGKGAFMGYTFTVDNEAPEVQAVKNEDGTITLTFKDNQYVAAVGILDVSGKKEFVPTFTPEQSAPGEESTFTFDPEEIGAAAANAATIFVADYAGNEYAGVVRTGDGPIVVERTVYTLASALEDGKEYLIANVNTAGNGYILNRNNTSAQRMAAAVSDANERFEVPFINGDDIAETAKFSAAAVEGGFKITNGGNYLRANTGWRASLQIAPADTNNIWTWDAENSRLSVSAGNTVYYLVYSNNNFTVNANANSVYLYEKQTYTEEVDPFTVSSVVLTPEKADLFVGNTLQIMTEVLPMTAEDKTLVWSSSDEEVATVDQNGLVAGVTAGTVTITAASASTEGVAGTAEITVLDVTRLPGATVNAQLVANGAPKFVKIDLETMTVIEELGEAAGIHYGGGRSEDIIIGFQTDGNIVETDIYGDGYDSYILGSFGTTQYNSRDGAHMPALTATEDDVTLTEEYISIFLAQSYLLMFTPDYSITGWNLSGYSALTYAGTVSETSTHYYYMLNGNGELEIAVIGPDEEDPIVEDEETGEPVINVSLSLYNLGPIAGLSAADGTFNANAMSMSLLETEDYLGLLIANSNNRRIYYVDLTADDLEAVLTAGFEGTSLTTLYNDDYDAEVLPPASVTEKALAGLKTESITLKAQKLASLEKAADGSLDEVTNYVSAAGKTNIIVETTAAAEAADPQAVPAESRVTVSVVEAEDVNNGKYFITYDPSILTYSSADVNAGYGAVGVDEEEGTVTLAFADLKGLEAGDVIANVFLTQPDCEDSAVTVSTAERNAVLSEIDEDFEIVVKGPGHAWGEPVWAWAEDYSSATATFTCLNDEDHVETVEAVVTSETTAVTTTYTATVEFEGKTYTDTIVEELPAAQVQGASASFAGEIKSNIYVYVPDAVLEDEAVYAEVTFNGETTTFVLKDITARTTVNGLPCLQFQIPVKAKELKDKAVLRIFTGDGAAVPLFSQSGEDATASGVEYSVQDYLTRMQENSTNPKMVKLAKAAEDYGTAAQLYFEYNAEGLTIPGDVTAVTLENMAAYAPVEEGTLPAGITKIANSVLFQSDNTLRMYYMYETGTDISKYTFTVDGAEAEVVDQASSKRCYVEVPAVAAKNLGDVHTFTVSDGADTHTYKISADGYAYKMVGTSTKATMVDLAKALYLYNLAAVEYFSN
ncbi:MAG: S8 family serine peptidase [Lachnospiraceae bacterium]|nr:S8 family serine peptidase [Lachnospiraceae bacterium]